MSETTQPKEAPQELMTEFARLTHGTTASIETMRRRAIFSDGEIPARLKCLAAVLWSVSARCEPCIRFYAARARELGATDKEVGEVLAVASAMGGCVGEMWALKAFEAYRGTQPEAGDPASGPSCCSVD